MTNQEFATIDLTTLKAEELKKLAKEHQVKNWWLMKKADLLTTLTEIQLDLQDKEAVEKANQESMILMSGTEDSDSGKKASGEETPKKKTPKVEKDQENLVTIKELAAEFNMKGTKARRLLRNESALRPYGSNRWEWDKVLHSEELEKVRDILKTHSKG